VAAPAAGGAEGGVPEAAAGAGLGLAGVGVAAAEVAVLGGRAVGAAGAANGMLTEAGGICVGWASGSERSKKGSKVVEHCARERVPSGRRNSRIHLTTHGLV